MYICFALYCSIMEINDLLYLAKKECKDDPRRVEMLELHIKSLSNLRASGRIHNEESCLSDAELLMIVLLEGFESDTIQNAAYGKVDKNPYFEALLELMDLAISKCRKTIHDTLYRQEDYWFGPLKEGITINFAGYFTASAEDFDNTSYIKWIITPLNNGRTKAHDIYSVYNHDDATLFPEFQVEFERNCNFFVDKIVDKEKFKEVFIREME